MKRSVFLLALLFSRTVLAVTLNPLPATDHVEGVVSAIALEWSKESGGIGTCAASAGVISTALPTTKDGWSAVATELFTLEFEKRTGEKAPSSTTMRVTSDGFDEEYIERAVAAVAEGNAYNSGNPAVVKEIEEQTEQMVSTLGHERDIHFLAVKTRIIQKTSGEQRIARIHAFINVKSGKIVQIFTLDGKI